MSQQQDNLAGRLLATSAIGYLLWQYPPGPYGDDAHKAAWYFGAFLATIGVAKSLPGMGAAIGNIRNKYRAFGHDETKGSAGWMTRKQIRKAKLHKRRKGARFVGTSYGLELWLDTETSHLILGPAGSQKTTAAILNILMGSPESMFIMDIKGELWEMVKAYREKAFGHRCFKVDPKDAENSVKINPLH